MSLCIRLRIAAQSDRRSALAATAFGLFAAGVALTGCGSGVSNLLPSATSAPNAYIPSGPTLGYVFTPTDGTLRAMLGIRGAARLSASIVPAGVYVAGDTSTASGAALLEDENGSLFSFTLPLSQPTHVADGLPAGARIVFAPGGVDAVAYVPGGSSVIVVTGLPATPHAQTIPFSGAGRLYAATVSDAGTVVAASQGSAMQIGTVSASGQFSRFGTVSGSPSFSFLAGAEDMLLADGAGDTLALVHSVSTAPMIQPLGATGLNQPVAVAASQDRHWAAVANGGDANVLRVDLTTGSPVQKLTCTCQPSLMSSLAGNAVFRVSTLSTGPVWTVDMASATPQLLFVPGIAQTKTP